MGGFFHKNPASCRKQPVDSRKGSGDVNPPYFLKSNRGVLDIWPNDIVDDCPSKSPTNPSEINVFDPEPRVLGLRLNAFSHLFSNASLHGGIFAREGSQLKAHNVFSSNKDLGGGVENPLHQGRAIPTDPDDKNETKLGGVLSPVDSLLYEVKGFDRARYPR